MRLDSNFLFNDIMMFVLYAVQESYSNEEFKYISADSFAWCQAEGWEFKIGSWLESPAVGCAAIVGT